MVFQTKVELLIFVSFLKLVDFFHLAN